MEVPECETHPDILFTNKNVEIKANDEMQMSRTGKNQLFDLQVLLSKR